MHNDTYDLRWPFSDLMLESQNIPTLSPAQHRSATWCSETDTRLFQFVPTAIYPSPGHHWKQPASNIFVPSFQIFMNTDPLWTSSSSGWRAASLFQVFLVGKVLQALHHLCSPFLDSIPLPHVSPLLKSPALDTALQMWPCHCWAPLWTCWQYFAWCILLAFFIANTLCWLMFNLMSIRRTSGHFLPGYFPASWSLKM